MFPVTPDCKDMAVPVAETNMVADHNVSNPAKPIKDIMGTAMTYNKSLK